MAISDAVGLERVSRTVGYKVTKGNFQTTTPNLPQKIAILAEANTDKQGSLSTTGKEFTSAKKAAEDYGYGSPIHSIMRILRPSTGGGVGGIPTVVFPQAAAGGSVAKIVDVTPTGTATGNGTHYVKIAGRDGLDGQFYAINIVTGDTAAIIAGKITDAVNGVLASPMTATTEVTPDRSQLTAKWTGLTSNEIDVEIEVGDDALGMTYGVAVDTAGSGTPSVTAGLSQFGNEWYTIVINSYGTVAAVVTELEAFNGFPDEDNPTGRYAALTWKPFEAYTGSVSDDDTTFTDSKKDQVTIALCPAPLSKNLTYEIAASYARLAAVIFQNTPELDLNAKFLPEIVAPTSIGSMASYDNRDAFLKLGSSTVDLVQGKYQIQDFVTTYHPDGETPPQYRYVRNLNLDKNFKFGYELLRQSFVVDHVIVNDNDVVATGRVIKPKEWKAILANYAEDVVFRKLIVDAAFTISSIQVGISATNPDRLETSISYKRSGIARIESTTVQAGFNFGQI